LASVRSARAQNRIDRPMPYVIVARWRPRDGERDRIEAILRELVSEVRKEPGNLAFVAQRSNDDPYEFLLYEQCESEQAFRDHQQTPHFKRLVLERAVPMLARRERQAFTIVE
ncbi:MAG: putative quinol monooxygenase, partial [Xanthobacteraceae bacterium]